ncbi:MAG: FG-GAP repeat domain-containing protein [Pseudohongiellaceae bacterium]
MKITSLATSILGLVIASFPLNAQDLNFKEQGFSLPDNSEKIILADFNADGLNDLLVVLDDRLRFYFQKANGFDFAMGYQEISFSSQAVGWDISAGYNNDDSISLLALVDGDQVLAWHPSNYEMQGPETIATNMNGFMSKGLSRLHFSNDINDDGLEDLVIPGPGTLQIYIQESSSNYEPALSVQAEFRIRTNLESSNLERRIGQAVRIPFLELRDINADGLADLISKTEETLHVFLASGDSLSYFSATPSYSLDIAEIQQRLGEFDIENLDFSNLTGVLALTHEEILEDIDGDGIADLMLREGGKVTVYGGTNTGMEFSQPRQILRSGGNVLSTFLYDENEDGLKDLWLWRVEPISVSDIFVWLALSGSIAVEAFVYPNQGERFARRPARKLTVNLKFPSVMRLVSSYGGLQDELESDTAGESLLSGSGDFKPDLPQQDLVALIDQQLLFFMGKLEADEDSEFMSALGYSRTVDNYEIDIKSILDEALATLNPSPASIDQRSADQIINLATEINPEELITAQVNGDSIDEIFIFRAPVGGQISGILLTSDE